MVIYYKNSFLASVVSILGSVLIVVGIAAIAEGEDVASAIAIILIGAFMTFYWGKKISQNKEFKKWTKGLQEKGIEAQMKTSFEVAKMVYEANPSKQTIEYIRKHNPVAAEELSKTAAKK